METHITNPTKYSLKLLSNIYEAVNKHFDYDFSQRQLAALITKQPKEIIAALVEQNGDDGLSVDNFINGISKKITGQDYPFPGCPDNQRQKFFIKFNMRKIKYFELIERIKQ